MFQGQENPNQNTEIKIMCIPREAKPKRKRRKIVESLKSGSEESY